MAHTTADWSAWKPEVDAYVNDENDKLPAGSYTMIFSVEQTNRLQKTEITDSGYGPMQEVGENGDAVEDENQEGYTTNYQRRNYRKKAVFSKTLWDTDQLGEIKKRAKGLVAAIRYSRQLYIWSLIRRGWDQTLLHGDGKSGVSLSHPRKDGGTAQANTFSDGVQKPLTYDNVKALEDQINTVVSNSGNLMTVGSESANKVIVTGYANRVKAFNIADIDGADGEPDGAENNVNYFKKGAKYDVLITKFLNYEAAKQAGEISAAKSSSSNFYDSLWGIVDLDIAKNYYKVYEGIGYPYYDDEIKKSNESLIKYAYDAYTWGETAWYPGVWSKGDNSTYAS